MDPDLMTPPDGPRPLWRIAQDIRKHWRKKDGTPSVNYAAEPYLAAMATLESAKDNYFLDSGKSIVLYFLSNAASFRGQEARVLKAELKEAIK